MWTRIAVAMSSLATAACGAAAYPIAVIEASGRAAAVAPPDEVCPQELGRDAGAVDRFAHALGIDAAPIAGCLLGADRVDTYLIAVPDDGERYWVEVAVWSSADGLEARLRTDSDQVLDQGGGRRWTGRARLEGGGRYQVQLHHADPAAVRYQISAAITRVPGGRPDASARPVVSAERPRSRRSTAMSTGR